MTPTFTDPRTGETVGLRRIVGKYHPGITMGWEGTDVTVSQDMTGGSLLRATAHVAGQPEIQAQVLIPGDITNPADVQSALWALEGALAGRERAEENKRLRDLHRAAQPFVEAWSQRGSVGSPSSRLTTYEREFIWAWKAALTKEAPDA